MKLIDMTDEQIEKEISRLSEQRDLIHSNLIKLATEKQRRTDPAYWKARFEAEKSKSKET